MKFYKVLTVSFVLALHFPVLSQPINLENLKDVSNYSEISGQSFSDNSIHEIYGSFDKVLLERMTNEGSLIKIKGTDYKFQAGTPVIPMKNIHFKLRGDYQITNVSVLSGKVREGKTKNSLMPQAKRIRHNSHLNIESEKVANNVDVFKTDEFFPGKWLTFTAGYDGEFTHVYIHLYPVQWNPKTYNLLFLQEYLISISGIELSSHLQEAMLMPVNHTHIILSRAAWLSTADSIAQFHNSQEMPSAVINVDEIYQTYPAAEDPTHLGYANMTNSSIQNYNYTNAKKITAYLRDNAAHPNAKLITILGAGEIIPPSYYFYIPVNVLPSRATYFSWIPSDHYYSSPDYDWIDNFAVNRISVHTESDLILYYHKMLNWNSQLSGTWINNTSLSGGIPCGTNYFLGELCNNHIICSNICCGFNIKKFQNHLGNYDATSMLNHLKNDDMLFHYNDSHGSGRAIYFDDNSYFGVTELSNLPTKKRLPIFLSLACMNGNFDTECVNNPWGSGISFAESMITSPGGGIAFIGGARYTTGDVLTELDNGNIRFLGQNQLYALLFHYMQAYRQVDIPYLGQLYRAAKDSFLLHQDMTEDNAKVAYTQIQAFCDAALRLPVPPAVNPSTTVPSIFVNGALTYPNNNYQVVNLNSNENPVYNIIGSDQYDLMTINISRKTTHQIPNVGNSFTVQSLHSNQLLLNKVINSEGKEAWHYSIVNKGLKKIDGDLSDWFPEEVIGSDNAGDIIPDKFDLTSIYAVYDSENDALNFALPINPCAPGENIYYIIAIDDQPSSGFQNNYSSNDIFPFPIYLGFENATINKLIVVQTNPSDYFESPYEISKYKYYEYHFYNNQTYWIDYPIDDEDIGGVAFADSNTIEITIPAGIFDYANFKMAVFSSLDNGVMEDVIPSSLLSPPKAVYGPRSAYSISSYIDLNEVTNINDKMEKKISDYFLYPNYPNPFNSKTVISYQLPVDSGVELNIYNLLGRKVMTLVSAKQPAGTYKVEFDASDLASGVYFYSLVNDQGFISTRKLILLK